MAIMAEPFTHKGDYIFLCGLLGVLCAIIAVGGAVRLGWASAADVGAVIVVLAGLGSIVFLFLAFIRWLVDF